MAELKCKDGTTIKISDETETELRKAFAPKPKEYKDSALRVYIGDNASWPITVRIAKDYVGTSVDYITRNIEDTEAFILALQKVVAYCKLHHLG